MGSRAYRRDKRGRFAGAGGGGTTVTMGRAGGFAHAGHRSMVLGQRASGGKSLGGAAGAKGTARRPPAARATRRGNHPGKSSHLGASAKSFAKKHEKVIIGGAVVGAAAIGGRVAYNKVNPGQTLKKSGLEVPGAVKTFGGKSAKAPAYSVVENATHRFTTFSAKEGRFGKAQQTVIEKKSPKGKTTTTIGYIKSQKSLTGGYKVTHTYLTTANRGKGLGKQALAAHAAHRPTRTYRASMDRSTMGQAFAKSVGGAGVRSGKSKAAGSSITKTLDYDFRVASRASSTANAKFIVKTTKTMAPHKMVSGKKIRKGRRR